MKTIARLFTIIIVLAMPFALLANVVIKGHITYPNGQSANNYPVVIQSDSINISCTATHFKATNLNGIYQDTLVCNGAIKHVKISVRDCQNNIIYKSLDVPSSGIVEANFVICLSGQCHTDFTWINDGSNQIFKIVNTQAGNSTATIVNYNWNFGDGTFINTKVPTSPSHTFKMPGNHNVCLTITTSDSCQSTACHTIAILTQCTPNFTWMPLTNAANQIKFNSVGSKADSIGTDSIVSRKWLFGDGDSLLGNRVDPTHQYIKAGNYTVCLTIKTLYGCEHSICILVHTGTYLNTCHANFSNETLPQTSAAGFAIRYNSQSKVAVGDSIIGNYWAFGDGSSISGNIFNPAHIYQKTGTYTVCLRILSSGGCSDSICQTVVILPQHCQVAFNWVSASINDTNRSKNNIHFQSNMSKATTGYDSITTRKWVFGDGTTLGGNVIDPMHSYASPGNYRVCLYIQTATKCIDSICQSVMVAAPNSDTIHHDFIRLVNTYPNPATSQFNAVIWSMYNNVNATLTIYNAYGNLKWTQKTSLSQGSNNIPVPLSQLGAGIYIFRITTIYGVASKTFLKL